MNQHSNDDGQGKSRCADGSRKSMLFYLAFFSCKVPSASPGPIESAWAPELEIEFHLQEQKVLKAVMIPDVQ